MNLKMNRRQLVFGSLALSAVPLAKPAKTDDDQDIRLAVATYSLRSFPRTEAIKMIRQLNVRYVDVKEFHLPYKDSPEHLAAGRKEFEDAGLKIIAGGNISLQKDDEADLRRYFEYAKTCGMPMMVIAPTHETLPKIEKLVKEYNIKVALHNHGPEDKHFPTPQSVLDAVKNMDPRVGLCMDIGHTARTGKDVVESIAEAGPRLLEMHMKDLADMMDKNSQVAVGDGKMPIPAIFKQLRKMNYTGYCSLEYEVEAKNPLPGMMKSFAYMRGVIAGQKNA
ncbi:MAG: sugar phosphate isomerase/epimerase [Acidobacteriota bacterium]|nr:sugar phosphate isomerase/epimerase [Acidobacteriota bacterium]